MAHLSDGTLRRKFDDSDALTESEDRHYSACADCQGRYATLADDARVVAGALAVPDMKALWSELLARVDAVAGGLAKLGVARGDTVALMLGNRPEFHIADLAAVTIGATPFSIYTTYPAHEISYLINDAGSRVIVVEQAFLPVVLEARAELPQLEHVIVVDGDAPEGTIALADVEGVSIVTQIAGWTLAEVGRVAGAFTAMISLDTTMKFRALHVAPTVIRFEAIAQNGSRAITGGLITKRTT